MRQVGKYLLILAIAVSLIAAVAARAAAQVATLVLNGTTTTNDVNQPFLLSTIPSDVVESIADYRRYCQRSQWEKAFKQLDKLHSAKSTVLAPYQDGVMVPPTGLLQRLFAELPEDGKKAYRLFNDAEAKNVLDQAQGKDEADKLATVATEFLYTSSGDVAADRWGDLLFEKGDFSGAIQAWRSILKFRPDSAIPPAQLLTKVAIALARDERWPEFQQVAQQMHDRYAEASVTLGGKSVLAVEHLEKLGAHHKGVASTSAAPSQPGKPHLIADSKPLWQFRWFAAVNPELGNREGLVVYDQMYGRQYASDFVPPTIVDAQRIYSDMVGYEVGIDLATGKLAWRSGRFFDLMKNNQQNQFNNGRSLFLEQSAIAACGDKIWSVARDPGANQNSNEVRYYLLARDPGTGKELFNSKSAKDGLKEWSITGMPVADETHLYVGAYKPNQPSDLYALCLSRSDGKLLWNTKLGSYKTDPRQLYYSVTRLSVPALLLSGGKLYVDTNAGSFVQLNPSTGAIAWGLNYDAETPSTDRYYNQPPEQVTCSAPVMVDGVLYIKGMRSRRLYAVDPEEPKVLWSRPVSENAVLAGVDRERAYLGGEEITAYDLKTQQLLWSKPVPMGTSWVRPLMTGDRIYQFTPRGIYEIEKATGDIVQLFRGADMESVGGRLMLTPHALVAISNIAITAYPVEEAASTTASSDPK
ncbi:MAG TPA: PQQ-binding-like beta-propeller repeat protein [Pirellulales bacterium]|nr:PQQ-binding-like beta-propeller repeat protein [Pirellulales bacterium]